MNDWRAEMAGLSSAEEFLEFFGVEHDVSVVHVHRLHILQRFHDYLLKDGESYEACCEGMRRAYEDFVRSDARAEQVFKVFRRESAVAFVSLSSLLRRGP